jgi:TP901 family phage tail tape measure protein
VASASNIKAGSAYVELLVKDSKLVSGLNAASKRLQAFGSAITSIGKKMVMLGTAVSAPLAAMGKAFASGGAALFDMTQRTGMSAEALSELGYAAAQTGSDLDTVEIGVRKMQKTIYAAANGSKSAAEAFAALGLSVNDLAHMNPEQQFEAIAASLSQTDDPTTRAALALQIFGRSGTALLPLMDHLDELRQKAKDLGLTSSSSSVRSAKALEDAFTDLGRVSKKTGSILGSALADTLRQTTQWMTRLIVKFNEFLKQHADVVVSVFKIAKAVVFAGTGLVVLGTIISKVGSALGMLSSGAIATARLMATVGSILAALASPIGLTIAALVALGAYLIYVSGLGTAALQWLGEAFFQLRDEALSAWQGMSDALAAGDLALAAKVLWLTLKLEWNKGIAALQPIWLEFKKWFLEIAYGAFYGALSAWEIVQHGLSVAWIETTAFLSKTWTNFTSFLQSSWESVQNWLEDRWHDLFALFDETYDAGAAKAVADRLSQQSQQKIEQQRQAALGRQEQNRSAQRQQESQQSDVVLAKIGGDYQQAIAEVTASNATKIKAAQDAVDQARAEWQKAIDEARAKRIAADAKRKGQTNDNPPDVNDQFAGLADALAEAQKRTIGVAGTFNAAEARGLGAGGVADRIAKAAEQTAINTKKLLEEMRDMDPSEFE